jgi:hypothetical protein
MEARGCVLPARTSLEHFGPARRPAPLLKGAQHVDRGRSREVARGVTEVASGPGETPTGARLHEDGRRNRSVSARRPASVMLTRATSIRRPPATIRSGCATASSAWISSTSRSAVYPFAASVRRRSRPGTRPAIRAPGNGPASMLGLIRTVSSEMHEASVRRSVRCAPVCRAKTNVGGDVRHV